jgi:ABC-type branched-subunit amino acid transport system substrate-binding protein
MTEHGFRRNHGKRVLSPEFSSSDNPLKGPRLTRRLFGRALMTMSALAAARSMPLSSALAAEPIKIGFGMAQSGPLGGNGKAALLAIEMWRDNINGRGGLLGRPVQLIYYDDQTNPALIPGIYSKLFDVDKVDLVTRRLRYRCAGCRPPRSVSRCSSAPARSQ